jgi:hypothetical protein
MQAGNEGHAEAGGVWCVGAHVLLVGLLCCIYISACVCLIYLLRVICCIRVYVRVYVFVVKKSGGGEEGGIMA